MTKENNNNLNRSDLEGVMESFARITNELGSIKVGELTDDEYKDIMAFIDKCRDMGLQQSKYRVEHEESIIQKMDNDSLEYARSRASDTGIFVSRHFAVDANRIYGQGITPHIIVPNGILKWYDECIYDHIGLAELTGISEDKFPYLGGPYALKAMAIDSSLPDEVAIINVVASAEPSPNKMETRVCVAWMLLEDHIQTSDAIKKYSNLIKCGVIRSKSSNDGGEGTK